MKKLTNDKMSLTLLIFDILILSISIGYFSYGLILLENIETPLRIGIIVFLIILSVLFIKTIIKNIFKKKKLKTIIITIISIIIAAVMIIIGYNINKIYNAIANISTTSQTYSSSIVTRIDSEINDINDLKEEKIGILSDKESIDGYQIPQEIIKDNNLNNELVEYNNYLDMINALLDEKINAIFLPTNYSILFANIQGLEKLKEQTKIIYTKDKNIKVQKTLNSKNLDEPFTILLMGVDSENEEIKGSSFNGDSLVLITFNPKTLDATMLSIPRDTYVPITCFAGQKKNKITHAAWYGESCMMSTIENMFDINIDYYIKINFAGVVKIVDTLGGIDVNVPYSFCEQNSKREFGNSTVYVREGQQTLNGEQALALARNRHPWTEYCSWEWTNYNSNDFVRGQNQQLVIQGMLNKIKNINSVDTFYDMLNNISMSMETNMSTENILSFYNIAKDILLKNTSDTTNLSELIGFERMYLSGYDQMIVDYDGINDTGSGLSLYNFVPYKGSMEDISDAMKENLGLKEKTITKQYDFDINEKYEPHVIGKGYYEDYSLSLLPSFVGRDISEVQNYCNSRGISLTINKVSTNSRSLDGEVMTQSLPAGMDAQYAGSMTVSVAEYGKTIIDDDNDDSKITDNDTNTDNTNSTDNDDNNNNTTNNNDNTKTDDDEPDENIQNLISSNEETTSNISTN
mgnify:CR=1 FL=1